MKNLLLIFLLFPMYISAQVVAFEVQYKAEHGEYAAKLSTYNQIITMVEGITCNDFFLTTDNGKLTKSDRNCTWNYTPSNYKKGYGWVYFNKIEDGKTIIFHKKRLKIILMDFRIGFPPFQPNDYGVYHLTTKQLLKSRLYMQAYHKFYDKPIMITNTRITVFRDNELIINKVINEPLQDVYMERIDELYNLKEGDEIIFSKIKYQYPSVNDTFFEFEADAVRVKIKE
ncbi:MAG: hypothetical protein AB8G11_03345 [Saprospiraceae bacterium]